MAASDDLNALGTMGNVIGNAVRTAVNAVGTTTATPPAQSAQSGLGQLDIGTFTAPTVTPKQPTLTTDPNSAIFSDASPGYNLTSYGVDPNATSSLYADQLARDTGARGLRPEELQQVVGGAYQNVLGREADPEGYKGWASALGSGQMTVPEFQKAFIEAATANQENIAQTPEGAYPFAQLQSYGPVYTSGQFKRDLGGANSAAEAAAAQMEQYGFNTGTAGDWGEFKQDYDTSKIPEDFNWQQYVANNPDLREANIDTADEAMQHYLQYGQGEDRSYAAPFVPDYDTQAFLNQSYQDLLGRDVGQMGLDTWLPQLNSGELSQEQLLENIRNSPEYASLQQQQVDPRAQAIRDYLTLNPGLTDAQIAAQMDAAGYSPAEVAAATGADPAEVQARYDAAKAGLPYLADGGPVNSMEYFLAKNRYGV